MSLWTNAKTLVNTLFLSGTEITVNKTFGSYEEAAQAQADVNLLAAFMDAGVTRKKFSKRKVQNTLTIEDIFGEEPKPEPEKLTKEALMAWFNSLDEESKGFLKDLVK